MRTPRHRIRPMVSTERLDARALVCITIALLTWSSAYAAIAYALASFTPGEVAFSRLAIGSLCFAALLAAKRATRPEPMRIISVDKVFMTLSSRPSF